MDEKPTTMFIFQLLVLKIALPLCILRSDTSAEQAPSTDQHTDEHAREEDQAPIPKTVWPGDTRDSSHISRVLHLETHRSLAQEAREAKLLKRLTNMYHTSIQPLEDLYRFRDLNKHVITDSEINAKPLILLVGPWSTGKSTMINYLLGIEDPQHLMRTGAEPTTSEFTVLQHGPTYKSIEGMVLATDPTKQFSPLEKFGQGFLEKFQGLELPSRLLERVTLVDTPGIIENRKQQERGYPYNDVMRWFIDRADLVLVIFDPSKLDVGIELESLFKQLKGRESQIRLVLNKADVLSTQELMRVYGALFWNLAPLINVTEPPRVYVGSFWDKPFKPNTIHDLFLKEETSLLQDLYNTVTNHIENKITFVRQHAYLVRIHALVVDRHLTVFNAKRSIFGDAEVLLSDIIENPNKFNIYHSVLAEPYVSKYDLFPAGVYKEFFSINALNSFKVNEAHCTIMSGCVMDKLVQALVVDLPGLLSEFSQGTCEGDTCSP